VHHEEWVVVLVLELEEDEGLARELGLELALALVLDSVLEQVSQCNLNCFGTQSHHHFHK